MGNLIGGLLSGGGGNKGGGILDGCGAFFFGVCDCLHDLID